MSMGLSLAVHAARYREVPACASGGASARPGSRCPHYRPSWMIAAIGMRPLRRRPKHRHAEYSSPTAPLVLPGN